MSVQNVIIIGAGPAGYTAAIYAARAGLHPILYQGLQPGGQLMLTTDVDNYPGYPNGILGPDMMLDFKNQASRFGTKLVDKDVTKVYFDTYPYKIQDNDNNTLLAKTIIIATGASAKWLGLENEKKFYGKGVSACAICDGFFFKDKDVAVVGGGDTAAEEALYLSKMCRKVYVFVRRNVMRASHIMQEKMKKKDNIVICWQTEVKEIHGKNFLENVSVYDASKNVVKIVNLKGLFIAIGHKPNTDLFLTHINVDQQGYIQTKSGCTATNLKGIFAAGDVQDPIYRQAITAASTGCMAALDVEKFLIE